ncbi:response regulator [uncultured Jannaschia sp.]|uniref:response regulator n=1 Tax=uncultured Jannaschia sp. TaxID=293347 RepID=UPI00260626B6|nr:response regulator [uncultured Jannaschia sp.]
MTTTERPLHGRTILLVEDEFLIQMDIQMQLEDAGATVVAASTVSEARACADQIVDAAVLDVRLSDGDIFPAADRLAERGIPIVFHSGHADPRVMGHAYPGSITLSKPSAEGALPMALARLTPIRRASAAG